WRRPHLPVTVMPPAAQSAPKQTLPAPLESSLSAQAVVLLVEVFKPRPMLRPPDAEQTRIAPVPLVNAPVAIRPLVALFRVIVPLPVLATLTAPVVIVPEVDPTRM